MNETQDRLYKLLPTIYQLRDAEQGYPLRELLRVIAEQVNLVEANIAQLYDNWFIETAEDWAVPYLGDLVGYEAVYEAGEPGDIHDHMNQERQRILTPRSDVANTVHFRRQRGTLAVLEILAQHVAGWPARAVEFYRLLGVTQAANHVYPERGQTVDVRQGDRLMQIGGPFDEAAHTVDVRRINSLLTPGRYHPGNVGLFVWRLKARQVKQTVAARRDEKPNCFTFSILGNDVPLYLRPAPEPDPTVIEKEGNLPVAIRRRAMERWQRQGQLNTIYGEEDGKSLAIWAVYEERRPGSRKKGRRAEHVPLPQETRFIKPEQIQVADLSGWHRTPKTPKEGELPKVMVDPELGRIVFPTQPVKDKTVVKVEVMYHDAHCDDMGGGTYSRPIIEPATPFIFGLWDIKDAGELATQLQKIWRTKLKLRAWVSSGDLDELPEVDEEVTDAHVARMIKILNKLLTSGELLYEDTDRTILEALGGVIRNETYNLWLKLINEKTQDEADIRLFNRLWLEDLLPQIARHVAHYQVNQSEGSDIQPLFRTMQEALAQWHLDAPRTAIIEICDSGVYEGSLRIELGEAQTLQIRAKNGERPVILLSENSHSRFDALKIEGERNSHLILDGLLIAGHALHVQGSIWVEDDPEASLEERAMSEIVLRHCTLVPGWLPAPEMGDDSYPFQPEEYSLELVDTGARVTIENSIVGSIRVSQNEVLTDPILIQIRDSIVDATDKELPAINGSDGRLAHAVLQITRSTVIGSMDTLAIEQAENSIFYGKVRVGRRQRGCMRFCWYDAPESRVPQRFHCQPDVVEAVKKAEYEARQDQDEVSLRMAQAQERQRVEPVFSSRRYGNPAYCQLATDCASEIKTGADDLSELGVHHDLYQPQRETNLRARLAAFVPSGIDADIIYVS